MVMDWHATARESRFAVLGNITLPWWDCLLFPNNASAHIEKERIWIVKTEEESSSEHVYQLSLRVEQHFDNQLDHCALHILRIVRLSQTILVHTHLVGTLLQR